jgi:hypothetical protein
MIILDDTVAMVTCCICLNYIPEDEVIERDGKRYCEKCADDEPERDFVMERTKLESQREDAEEERREILRNKKEEKP